jgi:hypothetical protein
LAGGLAWWVVVCGAVIRWVRCGGLGGVGAGWVGPGVVGGQANAVRSWVKARARVRDHAQL